MQKKAKIFYFTLTDEMLKKDKLDWFAETKLASIPFDTIHPDKNANWINLADDNDWETLIPIASKDVKAGKSKEALFELFFMGVPTNRDEWVYDFDKNNLVNKMSFFSTKYNECVDKQELDYSIKWSRDLKNELSRNKKSTFDASLIINAIYRPYSKTFHYTEKLLNDILTQNHYDVLGKDFTAKNYGICFSGIGSSKNFQTLAVNNLFGLDTLEKTNCFPLYRYSESGNRIDNITDWGLAQFRKQYCHVETQYFASLRKEDIFHYVYAVLHHPSYRSKYEQNLKREFPRIPFYANFWQWAAWGQELMDLHLNYETIEPFELGIRNYELGIKNPKAKLKANVESGEIVLDEQTTLSGIPPLAWEYKLGNRSALHWILDQYKEKTPSDPTIKAQFNTYQFSDYKESVIDLIQRVTSVSVRTMEIVNAMNNE